LTDAGGFPLTVAAFEGNKAETATMVPVINAFKDAHQLTDVTVVADAGMISAANQVALQAAGLSFILGARIPQLPDVVREWRDKHPDEAISDGLVLTQPWPSTSSEKARGIPDRVIHYQFRHDRARRTLRGIDEQVAKAERAVDGHAPVKRNRYIQLTGATTSVNRALEAKTRALAGWKGYTTNLTSQPAAFVIDALPPAVAYREGLPDVQARPTGSPDLPPHPRLHRSPPERRVRRDGRITLDRTSNRLEHQEIRANRSALPHRHHPSRQPHPHRRRAPTGRHRRRPRQNPRPACAHFPCWERPRAAGACHD
jgi:hypothetical protein